MKSLLLLVSIGALPGCAQLAAQVAAEIDWEAAPRHARLEPVYVEVDPSELPRLCGNQPGALFFGCARREHESRRCVIVTGPRPAQWLLDHERKHCAGYDHAPLALRN
jgi:hypothetical protein